MTIDDQIYVSFRAYIAGQGDPPFEPGQIEELANSFKNFAYPALDEASLGKIIGELKEQFTVTQLFGGGITDNTHEPWWERFKTGDDKLYYWSRLNQLLMQDPNLPSSVTNRLDSVTDTIIDLAGDPGKQGHWNRRGMVIGHVQSGKTMNYSAVICKAADAGYKVIILLAGITNSLRRQTQDRINEAFIGRRASKNSQLMSERVGVGKIGSSPIVPHAGTFLEGDFSATALQTAIGYSITGLEKPIIFVCKKNVSTLRNLLEYFNASDNENKLDLPLLLIDDEADNASINTKAEKKQITAINSGIREILRKFNRSSYLGYTATPFANIFIDPDDTTDFGSDDLFPANYIRTLEAPSNYIGADKVFGYGSELFERMVVPIDDFDQTFPLKHKNHHPVNELPASLRRAVIHFILVKAIRTLRGDGSKHCTMMINVSRFNSVQTSVEGLVYELINEMRDDLRVNATASKPTSRSVLHEFESEYYSEFVNKISDDEYSYPNWKELKNHLFKGWSVEVTTVNMSGGMLDYDAHKENGLTVIAIGGLALSRGLTLEGLCVTYILRNAGAYDTLMQMGRWFGYRPNYEDLCRLYLHEEAIDHYQATSEAIEELRAEVEFMAMENLTPTEFGLKVRQSPFALKITAANKMRSSVTLLVDVGFRGKSVDGHTIYLDENLNQKHIKITSAFLQSLGQPINSADTPVQKNTLLWQDVKVNSVLQFLEQFRFPSEVVGLTSMGERSMVADFISAKKHQLSAWNVHLNNPVEDETVEPEHISDYLSTNIFAGRKISLRIRTGVKFGDRKYKINEHRKVGTGSDAIAGLSKEQADMVIADDPEISNKFIKENSGFKPTLVIYFIKPRLRSEAEMVPFKDGIVSFTIHFPAIGNLDTVPKTYQANSIYQQLELNFENDEDDEAQEILSAEN